MSWGYVEEWDELGVCGGVGRVGGTRRGGKCWGYVKWGKVGGTSWSGKSWGYVKEWDELGVREVVG